MSGRLLKISSQCFIFPGSIPMATWIVRHMMEDSLTLKTSMDKILRVEINPPPNSSIREQTSDISKKSAINSLCML